MRSGFSVGIFELIFMLMEFNEANCVTDFDGDDMLGISDLKQVIERLIGPQNNLSDNDMKQLIQNILAEADLDDDHALSFPEFEQ